MLEHRPRLSGVISYKVTICADDMQPEIVMVAADDVLTALAIVKFKLYAGLVKARKLKIEVVSCSGPVRKDVATEKKVG